MALITIDTDVLCERIERYQDKAQREAKELEEARENDSDLMEEHIKAVAFYNGMVEIGTVVAQYLINVVEGLDPTTEA